MVDTIDFELLKVEGVQVEGYATRQPSTLQPSTFNDLLPDASSLAPLPIPQPDAVRRFQAAMEEDISREDAEPQREYLALSSQSSPSVLVTDSPIEPSRTSRTSREEYVSHRDTEPQREYLAPSSPSVLFSDGSIEPSRTSRTLREEYVSRGDIEPQRRNIALSSQSSPSVLFSDGSIEPSRTSRTLREENVSHGDAETPRGNLAQSSPSPQSVLVTDAPVDPSRTSRTLREENVSHRDTEPQRENLALSSPSPQSILVTDSPIEPSRTSRTLREEYVSRGDIEPQMENLAPSSPRTPSVLVPDAPFDPSRTSREENLVNHVNPVPETSRTLRTSREENLVNHENPAPETLRTSRTSRVATIEHLEMNPIVFDIGSARNPVRVALPDVSGLKPLELPPSLLGNVERFQQAIDTPAATTAAAVSRPPIMPVAPEAVDTLAPVSFFTDSNGTTLPYREYIPESAGSSGIDGFSRRDAEPQRGVNVANVEMLPTSNANVANLKSEIGTGNLSSFQPFNFSTFPLVLFMHGAGTRGDDGTAFTGNVAFKALLSQVVSKTPAIVLAPQCPVNEKWVDTPWEEKVHAYNPAPSRYMAAALELLDRELATLPVDRTRIYVCGNSMGGYATWDLLSRRPDLFAAAIPVCGGGTPEKVVEASRTTPVWTVHGDADDVVPVENTRSIVAAVRADSAHAADFRYREMPGVKHDCWTATFTDPEIMDWFFAQRREVISSRGGAETQRENLAQSSPSPQSKVEPSRTLRTSREEYVSHEAVEPQRDNLAQSSPSSPSVFSSDVSIEPSRTLRTSREEYVSHEAVEPQREPNVANVEVLPIANANVANLELGIGTGNIDNTGHIANLQPSTQSTVETVNQIVEAVAAEIAVTPALAGGDGEIRIMLKPSVLDGSEIRLTAKAGELTVAIAPATPEAAALAAAALPRLETALAAHAPSFHHVAVVLAAGKKGTENETA